MLAVTAILLCLIKIRGLFKSTKWRHFENVKFEALSARRARSRQCDDPPTFDPQQKCQKPTANSTQKGANNVSLQHILSVICILPLEYDLLHVMLEPFEVLLFPIEALPGLLSSQAELFLLHACRILAATH